MGSVCYVKVWPLNPKLLIPGGCAFPCVVRKFQDAKTNDYGGFTARLPPLWRSSADENEGGYVGTNANEGNKGMDEFRTTTGASCSHRGVLVADVARYMTT